jgi:hypothetical protein
MGPFKKNNIPTNLIEIIIPPKNKNFFHPPFSLSRKNEIKFLFPMNLPLLT